jgi:hypothetical protein
MKLEINDESRQDIYRQAVAIEVKLESLLASVRALVAQVADPEPEDKLAGIDPKDPRNKLSNQKLTERGVEVCYRLFDAGKSRYAVGALMEISFSAAKHRYELWLELGGAKRTLQPLD